MIRWRSSISIISTIFVIIINVLINCIHFVLTVFRMYEDSVSSNSIRVFKYTRETSGATGRICLIQGNRMQDSKEANISWNAQNMADLSKEYCHQSARYFGSPTASNIQCGENAFFLFHFPCYCTGCGGSWGKTWKRHSQVSSSWEREKSWRPRILQKQLFKLLWGSDFNVHWR